MLIIPLPTNVREIIRGKFLSTITEIESAHQEVYSDVEIHQDWSAEAVLDRIKCIKKSFFSDLENLINEVKIQE